MWVQINPIHHNENFKHAEKKISIIGHSVGSPIIDQNTNDI